MNDFAVDIQYLLDAGDEIVQYAKNYQSYVEKLESIKNALSFEVRARAQIDASLKLLNSTMTEQASSLMTLGESLKEFSETYRKSEDTILSNQSGLEWETIDVSLSGGKETDDSSMEKWLEELQEKLKEAGVFAGEGVGLEDILNVLNNGISFMDSYGINIYSLLQVLRNAKNTMQAFKIVQNGAYYIIKGMYYTRSKDSILKNIKGNRYKIGSEAFKSSGLFRFNPSGSTFSQNISKFWDNITDASLWQNEFKNFNVGDIYKFQEGDTLGNIGKAVGYLAVAADTGMGIYENVMNGASGSKIAADATVDVAKGLGGMAVATGCAHVGAAIGTAIPVPVVGTVVGAAAGFALGYVGNAVYNELIDGVEIGGKTVAEWASTGLETAIDTIGDVGSDIADAAGNALDTAKDAVGDFVGGIGNFLFG